ncbi:hypothetical protein BIFDEN_01457 [Bifidobacterium dentium ATCC 27678]|nr:hypothetical protein BIFDEN_01457 [Bifidobacterium dentium ATCC 27678]
MLILCMMILLWPWKGLMCSTKLLENLIGLMNKRIDKTYVVRIIDQRC